MKRFECKSPVKSSRSLSKVASKAPRTPTPPLQSTKGGRSWNQPAPPVRATLSSVGLVGGVHHAILEVHKHRSGAHLCSMCCSVQFGCVALFDEVVCRMSAGELELYCIVRNGGRTVPNYISNPAYHSDRHASSRLPVRHDLPHHEALPPCHPRSSPRHPPRSQLLCGAMLFTEL